MRGYRGSILPECLTEVGPLERRGIRREQTDNDDSVLTSTAG
jgi:hypothetical protein